MDATRNGSLPHHRQIILQSSCFAPPTHATVSLPLGWHSTDFYARQERRGRLQSNSVSWASRWSRARHGLRSCRRSSLPPWVLVCGASLRCKTALGRWSSNRQQNRPRERLSSDCLVRSAAPIGSSSSITPHASNSCGCLQSMTSTPQGWVRASLVGHFRLKATG